MSCHGSRKTNLFRVHVEQVSSYDDGEGLYPFLDKYEIEVQLLNYLFTLTFIPTWMNRKRKIGTHNAFYKWGFASVKRVGTFDWSADKEHRSYYNGDYTERTDYYRSEGQ